jgi:sigma-B regulation protein RsbU (phosphoserine phosphatase)
MSFGQCPSTMSVTCIAEPRILIADDQSDLVDALRLLLKNEGMRVDAVSSPEAALAAIRGGSFDLLLMDLNYTGDTTSGREGIALLSRVQALDRLLPVVVMTGWGSVDIAVEAMRHGVRDFVQKPWDNGQLLQTLRTEIEAGRARRQQYALEQRDMDEARRIQRKLLPATMPQVDGCEIAASWQPAAGVGGDCYDAIPSSHSRIGLSIADVVGKGIPAALLMSNLQATLRAFATELAAPADVCQQANRVLCGHIAEGRFISFFYCVVDTDEGTLTYSNAGHHPPILVRADGRVERLGVGGPVLGIFASGTYDQAQVALESGDRLILYTDGITEVTPPGADGENGSLRDEFGDVRLTELIHRHRGCSAPALQSRLTDAVAHFSSGTFQDDATLIVMAAD